MGNEEAFVAAAARAEAEEERSVNVSEYLRLCHQGSKELNSGKQKAAMKTLKKAIKLEPMNPAAHHNIGHAYLLQGDFLLSHQAFVAALECDRQVPAALLPSAAPMLLMDMILPSTALTRVRVPLFSVGVS